MDSQPEKAKRKKKKNKKGKGKVFSRQLVQKLARRLQKENSRVLTAQMVVSLSCAAACSPLAHCFNLISTSGRQRAVRRVPAEWRPGR